jgi:hypothetical protein
MTNIVTGERIQQLCDVYLGVDGDFNFNPTIGRQTTKHIYLNNINEKIKTDVLKKNLYMLLSQYGKIKQIIACKGIKMRGQVSR